MTNQNIAIIMCPPLSRYAKQPDDISKCELIDCPSCKNKMWFSEKKKEWKEISEIAGKEIIFECYDCLEKRAKEDPDFFINGITRFNI